MKIKDYLLNQSSLVKTQLEKNHKLVNDLLLLKSQNPSKLISNNNIPNSSINSVKDDKFNKDVLKEENDYFIQLYAKTKKLYPTKVEETFKDLICQYKNNDYKIPDLSDKKNLFNQNPLLLVGRDLNQFYMYNNKNKIKNKSDIMNQKHINFIKKEMLFMEKIINKNNEIKKKSNNNLYGSNNNDDEDNEINYKNEKINYFMVDSVWDKIKKQKKKQRYIEQSKLLKNKKKMAISLNKNRNKLKINISSDKSNIKENIRKMSSNNKSNLIDSYNTFHKNSKTIKNTNNFSNLKSLNSINTMNSIYSIKNMQSKETIPTNISRSTESPIKKLKHNLLNTNIFNEESIKLRKEIEDIKNTLNNSNLMEKNIIMERRMKMKSNKQGVLSFSINNNNNNKTNKSMSNQVLPLFSNKKSSPLLFNANGITNESEQSENKIKYKKQSSIQLRKAASEEKNEDLPSKNLSLKIFELIKKRTLPFLSLNKLTKEQDPQNFLKILSKLDLKMFNRKEIEKIMKNYCYKVLNYNEKETERIININRNDENIYRIIEKIINKTKKNSIEQYGKYSLRSDLEEVNNSIYNLKKKFILGKTDYNYDQ